jgi:hypothetical protein
LGNCLERHKDRNKDIETNKEKRNGEKHRHIERKEKEKKMERFKGEEIERWKNSKA